MKGVGEGIAFAGLCVGAAILEVNGDPAQGLWALAVIWAICTDWGQK